MEKLSILNKNKNCETYLHEYIYIKILIITYSRDKRLYKLLKNKYEILFQKDFDEEILNLK